MQRKTTTIELEVIADADTATKRINTDLSTRKGNALTGSAELDLQEVSKKAISDVTVIETGLPLPVSQAIENTLDQGKRTKASETFGVTLEIEIDQDELWKLIEIDWTEWVENQIEGHAQIGLDDICSKVITHVGVVESDAPLPITQSVEATIQGRLK